MNLFSSVWKWFGMGTPGSPDKGEQVTGPNSRSTDAGITVTDERALQISAVWACVRIITQAVAGLPIEISKVKGDGSKTTVSQDYYLHRIFNLSPNSYMSPLDFRTAITLSRVLWGNAYGLIEWNARRTEVISIIPLISEHMTVIRLGNSLTYHYSTTEGIKVYAQESIFHLKGFSLDGVMGLSPLSYSRQTMGISTSADKFASKSFANGGRPGGVITVDRLLTPPQRKALAEIYEGISSTADNGNKLWVLEGGTDYKAIGLPPDDMQMLETRRFQLGEIARIYGVPSHLINDTEKSTSWGSGIEQLDLGFLKYTLQAYINNWNDAIRNQLLPVSDRRKHIVTHDTDDFLRTDAKTTAEVNSKNVQNGIITRNEARQKIDEGPIEGADELTVQVNMISLEDLEKVNQGEPNEQDDSTDSTV